MKAYILTLISILLVTPAHSAPLADRSFSELQAQVYAFFSKDNFIQESYELTWELTEEMRVGEEELVSEELVIEVPKESKFAPYSQEHTVRSILNPIFDEEERKISFLDFKLEVSEIKGRNFQGVPTGQFSFETNAEDFGIFDKHGRHIYQKSIHGRIFGIQRRSFSLKRAQDFTFRIGEEIPEPLTVNFKIDVNFVENKF